MSHNSILGFTDDETRARVFEIPVMEEYGDVPSSGDLFTQFLNMFLGVLIYSHWSFRYIIYIVFFVIARYVFVQEVKEVKGTSDNNHQTPESVDGRSFDWRSNIVILVMVFANITTIVLLTYFYGLKDLPLESKVSVLLTINIALFAYIEADATRKQATDNARKYRLEMRRLKIEDLKYELEKLYGPLYSILYRHIEKGPPIPETIELEYSEWEDINELFSTYPHMISNNLFYTWDDITRKTDHAAIPEKFCTSIVNAYHSKVQAYQNLVARDLNL